jgi:membrane protease YdiL (CAAX protease family)
MRGEKMSFSTNPRIQKPLLSPHAALVIILVLWVVYTVVYSLHPGDPLAAVLEIIPGILAVSTLVAAGFQREMYYLRIAPISRTGATLLAASIIFMPAVWLTGRWTGWNWVAGLIFAPASAIAQELFFRSALLSILVAIIKKKLFYAILVQSTLFALWHVPKAFMGGAPVIGVIAVVVVTFLCGLLWSIQVQRDGTIIWVMIYHSVLLMVNSLLTWG